MKSSFFYFSNISAAIDCINCVGKVREKAGFGDLLHPFGVRSLLLLKIYLCNLRSKRCKGVLNVQYCQNHFATLQADLVWVSLRFGLFCDFNCSWLHDRTPLGSSHV